MDSCWHLVDRSKVSEDDVFFGAPGQIVVEIRDLSDRLKNDSDSSLIEQIEIMGNTGSFLHRLPELCQVFGLE